MNAWRRSLDIVLFNVLVLLFVPFGLELALALADPHRGLPMDGYLDGTLYTWGREVAFNRFGFRERDFETPKPPGVFRVMVLGDSITWGVGVSTNERYAGLLEAKLRAARPDQRIEVLNFALPGFSMVAYREMLTRYLDVAEPDAVLVGFCYNDPQPRLQEYSAERESFETRYRFLTRGVAPALERAGFPLLGKRLQNSLLNLAQWMGAFPDWMDALDRVYQKHSPEWISFVEDLRAIRLVLEARGLPAPIFLVLNQAANPGPQTPRRAEGWTYVRWYAQAEEAAAQNGWLTANCASLIPTDAPRAWFVINTEDGHPSAALHALYARRAAEAIARLPAAPSKRHDRR